MFQIIQFPFREMRRLSSFVLLLLFSFLFCIYFNFIYDEWLQLITMFIGQHTPFVIYVVCVCVGGREALDTVYVRLC